MDPIKIFEHIHSKLVPNRVQQFTNQIFSKIINFIYKHRKIKYSKDWYEKDYHLKIYHLDKFSYDKLMNIWEKKGYKKRLFDVLDMIKIPSKAKWLETGCHHGKTVFWSAERYLDSEFYMFDFSNTAIEWIKKNNPIPEKTIIWVGDIQKISFENKNFDNFFDIITCLDVTEHLTFKIYKNGINEMYRVLKPNGILIISQGISNIPEHINIRPEQKYIRDFLKNGFKFVQKLPYRHYYFTK